MAEAKQADEAIPGDFKEADYDVIYYATRSCPFSQRVRSVLEAKGIKYKWVESVWKYDFSSGSKVTIKEKWFSNLYATAIGRAANSDGQSPMIKIVKDGKVYTDSVPCCRLLDIRFKDTGASVCCLDDADKAFRNEKLLEYITSSFGRKVFGAKDKEGVEALKQELIVLDAKMREFGDDKVTDKLIFGENPTLCDVCLFPLMFRIPGSLKYRALDEFKLDEYLKEKCPRVAAWYAFVTAQSWAKNACPTIEEWIAHLTEMKM